MEADIDFKRAAIYCLAVGAGVGVIASIPILRLPNICCLWIIAGGFAAAYLSARDVMEVEAADCAIIGGVYGLIYGVAVNVATFVVNLPLNILGVGALARGFTGGGVLDRLGVHIGLAMFGDAAVAVLNIILGVVFGCVGGLAYAALAELAGPKPKPRTPARQAPKGKWKARD